MREATKITVHNRALFPHLLDIAKGLRYQFPGLHVVVFGSSVSEQSGVEKILDAETVLRRGFLLCGPVSVRQAAVRSAVKQLKKKVSKDAKKLKKPNAGIVP